MHPFSQAAEHCYKSVPVEQVFNSHSVSTVIVLNIFMSSLKCTMISLLQKQKCYFCSNKLKLLVYFQQSL